MREPQSINPSWEKGSMTITATCANCKHFGWLRTIEQTLQNEVFICTLILKQKDGRCIIQREKICSPVLCDDWRFNEHGLHHFEFQKPKEQTDNES